MTEAEKNEIVGLVMTEISSQAVDFDIETEQPQANDLLTAVRQTSSGEYKGVTLKWDDVARIATELANQAATRAEQALSDTTATKTEVGNMKASVEQTVTDFNALAEEKKQEVQGVYQSDLNAESTARQTADNTLQQNIDSEASTRAEADTAIGARIDSETTTRESEVAELERVNAIQKYEIENLKAKAEGQIYREEIVDANTYKLDIPSSVAPYAELQKIGGKSVVWNQLVPPFNTTQTSNGITIAGDGSGKLTITVSSEVTGYNQINLTNLKFIQGHEYLMIGNDKEKGFEFYVSGHPGYFGTHFIYKATTSDTLSVAYYTSKSTTPGTYVKYPMMFDLTQMFGSGKEPTLEECKKIFSAEYYPYDKGSLKSFPVKTVRSVGKNLCLAKDVYAGASSYLETTLDGRDCIRFNSGKSVKNTPIKFKENTQYTVSFDLKMAEYISGGEREIPFAFFYIDGTVSAIYTNKSDFIDWKRVSKTSDSNKTLSSVGVYVNDYRTYCYVSNFQLEEGTVATSYSPYMESTIDLSSVTTDLKSAGSVHDEWSNGKKIKRVGERAYTSGDESESGYITDGTTTYYPLATPTEETVPEIDNYINVEGGGTLTFESDETVKMPVPSTTRFVVDLTTTTEVTE